MKADTSVSFLKGIGEKTKAQLEKIGVYTIGEILLRFPRDYVRYPDEQAPSEAETDELCAIVASVQKGVYSRQVKGMPIVSTLISDGKRTIHLIWFHQPFMKHVLVPGETFIFYGLLRKKGNEYHMDQPGVFSPDVYQLMQEDLQPVYFLPHGLSHKNYLTFVREAIKECEPLEEIVPADILDKRNLVCFDQAARMIHFPKDENELIMAHQSLAYHEFYRFLSGLEELKDTENQEKSGFVCSSFLEEKILLSLLPYQLTSGQAETWKDVKNDLSGNHLMHRLIQGDVGCGKTILAFLSMITAGENGFQSALMVPTEVLARQHYTELCKLLDKANINRPVYLLTGSTPVKEKKEIKKRLLLDQTAMVIGTHALLQEDCEFSNLGLVITDEQHRFGVRQRDTLKEKGNMPHLLVMSATPIPRTLALILYGDLQISTIRELPPGRKPIKNCVVDRRYYPKAVDFIKQQMSLGRQVYVICPLAEESEMMEGVNVISEVKKLQELMGSTVVVKGLNGKMKPKDKNRIMEEFLQGQIQVLVSTTVVEVGVNVPNATVMLIEGAERFGLAQLHQLRGRIGRGAEQSYCIFMEQKHNKEKNKRLAILSESNDGFVIAQKDLELRGPGDLLGIRQSGEVSFQFADIYQDGDLLKYAAEDIQRLKTRRSQLE